MKIYSLSQLVFFFCLGFVNFAGAQNKPIRIAVVGSGPAGAAIANAFHEKNVAKPGSYEVRVFEAASRLGGRSSSKEVMLNGKKHVINVGTQMNFSKLKELFDSIPELKARGLSEELQPTHQAISLLATNLSSQSNIFYIPRLNKPNDFREVTYVSEAVKSTQIDDDTALAKAGLVGHKIRTQMLGRFQSFYNLRDYLRQQSFGNLDNMTAEDFIRSKLVFDLQRHGFMYSDCNALNYAYKPKTVDMQAICLENFLHYDGHRSASYSQDYIKKMIESFEKIVEFTDLKSMSALNFMWQMKWMVEGGPIVTAPRGWDVLPIKLLSQIPSKNISLKSPVTKIDNLGSQVSVSVGDSSTPAGNFDFVFNTVDTDQIKKIQKQPVHSTLEKLIGINSYTSTVALHVKTKRRVGSYLPNRQNTPALAAESGLLKAIGGITFLSGFLNISGGVGDEEKEDVFGVFIQSEVARDLIAEAEKNKLDMTNPKGVFAAQVKKLAVEDLRQVPNSSNTFGLRGITEALEQGEIVSITAWKKALPVFPVYQVQAIEDYMAHVERDFPRVVNFGQYIAGRTVANTIIQGTQLANMYHLKFGAK